MALPSLFEDCKNLIERGQESWKSYFSKWEVFAKFEEDVPESYLVRESDAFIKFRGIKKKKLISQAKKRKDRSLLKNKRYQRKQKKIIKKKKMIIKNPACADLGHCADSSKESKDKFSDLDMLESNLKIFFTDFLRKNDNKLEVFGIWSMCSGIQESSFHNLFLNHQHAINCHNVDLNKKDLSCINQQNVPSKISKMIVSSKLVNPVKNTYIENIKRAMNSTEFHSQPILEPRDSKWNSNLALAECYFGFDMCLKNNLNESHVEPSSKITTQINFGSNRSCSSHLKSPSHETSELKSFDWDFSHKSPVSLCRKINKEYFIKRTFPKMNITQDGKRFRNLCLHKRTNSVSLSMENSNFTTPERKPSEQKCFSENVLQRKRRCPSKLFFDNGEDSESDDQTENLAPLIHSQNKKLKTQTVTEVLESDSDEYESIFDRVKKN